MTFEASGSYIFGKALNLIYPGFQKFLSRVASGLAGGRRPVPSPRERTSGAGHIDLPFSLNFDLY